MAHQWFNPLTFISIPPGPHKKLAFQVTQNYLLKNVVLVETHVVNDNKLLNCFKGTYQFFLVESVF